jgi:gluconolactonase
MLVIALLACSISIAETAPRVLAEGAQWQAVSGPGLWWAEGVVAAKDGTIYLSDVTRTFAIKQNNPGGTIYRYTPGAGAMTKYMEPSGMSNGLHVDKNGDLIIAQDADTGGRAVLRRNLATGATTVLANGYQGKKFNGCNDVTSDAQGRIYFTDARYAGTEPMELPNAVYRIDPDGKITQIIAEIFRPNGIEVSPDGRRLYVAAYNNPHLPTNPNGPAKDKFGITTGGIVAYDLDRSGNVSNGRVVFVTNNDLGPDGTAMDTNGNLYVALHNGNPPAEKSDIVVISREGKVIAHLPVPPKGLVTNLGFGRGSDRHTLYATTGAPFGLYRITTVRQGFYWK